MVKKIKKIIAISGLAGSGKTTVGRLVAKKLSYKLIAPTFKDLAKANNLSLLEFQKKANKNFSIDKNFDKELIKLAKKQKCVVSTWLGPWILKGNLFRVWLEVSFSTRALRLAKREGISFKKALIHIKKRDKDNILRYKKIYNIDITNHKNFNLIIDANKSSPAKIASKIVSEYKKFGG
ncbi:MAG: (d)CMP kinase [Candidatus Anstonellaceae archaeon]